MNENELKIFGDKWEEFEKIKMSILQKLLIESHVQTVILMKYALWC
jgi:hypothetical protein